ncbi:hypothetical protein BJ878DRAFT_562991 [Calycina marina]|uniref:Uncharacterized protein n=1 Tax=Calycina marina TaxID=1763456 RepID=A0A9P8CAJ2_9HELO|nr:hypothetical protein BJ878DRAFT_562991 [Calycina marina]
MSARIKWAVSSRNWPEIEKRLDPATAKQRLCLELNADSVSAAVATFIQTKVHELATRNNYMSQTRHDVQQYLSLNADHIMHLEDSDLCISVLAIVSTVYRPITIDELVTLLELPNGVDIEHKEYLVEISAKEFMAEKASKDPFLFQKRKANHLLECDVERYQYIYLNLATE